MQMPSGFSNLNHKPILSSIRSHVFGHLLNVYPYSLSFTSVLGPHRLLREIKCSLAEKHSTMFTSNCLSAVWCWRGSVQRAFIGFLIESSCTLLLPAADPGNHYLSLNQYVWPLSHCHIVFPLMFHMSLCCLWKSHAKKSKLFATLRTKETWKCFKLCTNSREVTLTNVETFVTSPSDSGHKHECDKTHFVDMSVWHLIYETYKHECASGL